MDELAYKLNVDLFDTCRKMLRNGVNPMPRARRTTVEGSVAGYQPRVAKPTTEIAAPSAGTSAVGWMNQFSPSGILGESLTSDVDAVAIATES